MRALPLAALVILAACASPEPVAHVAPTSSSVPTTTTLPPTTVAPTTTEAPRPPTTRAARSAPRTTAVPAPVPAAPAAWVDAGHGVLVPPILLEIRRCESGGSYTARNPRSSASGAYQALDSSWARWGGWERAYLAPGWAQDTWAVEAYRARGTRPWYASRHCWG